MCVDVYMCIGIFVCVCVYLYSIFVYVYMCIWLTDLLPALLKIYTEGFKGALFWPFLCRIDSFQWSTFNNKQNLVKRCEVYRPYQTSIPFTLSEEAVLILFPPPLDGMAHSRMIGQPLAASAS